jgi:predicted acetyltransferase
MISDALWIRIVDVAAALEGRRYSAEGDLTLELTDAFLPDCAGTWTLTAGAGGASVARSSHTPDLALDSTDLAAMYLGTFRATRLARAGRVRELRAGAAARADALFATDIAPWCSKVF